MRQKQRAPVVARRDRMQHVLRARAVEPAVAHRIPREHLAHAASAEIEDLELRRRAWHRYEREHARGIVRVAPEIQLVWIAWRSRRAADRKLREQLRRA